MNKEELDQIIEKSFRSEPNFHLSSNFAENLTFIVSRSEKWKSDLHEYLNLLAILVTLIAVVSGFYYYIDKELTLRIFTFITGNVIQVVLVAFILNFILFADRVLLPLLFNRWNKI